MSLSMHRIARTLYGKGLSLGAYRKTREYFRERETARTRKKIQRNADEIRIRYGGCDASELGFRTIDVDAFTAGGRDIAIDFLGRLSDSSNIDWPSLGKDLKKILDDGEKRLLVALNPKELPMGDDLLDGLTDALDIIVVADGEGLILRSGDSKLAVFAIDPFSSPDVQGPVLGEDAMKKIAIVLDQRCDFSLALLSGSPTGEDDDRRMETRVFEELASMGIDGAIGCMEKDLDLGGSFSRIHGIPFFGIRNLGIFPGTDRFQKGVSVALRLTFHLEERPCSIERAYIPLWVDSERSPISSAIKIDYRDRDQREDDVLMERLDYVERFSGDLRDERSSITLRDACDLLGIKLPAKYQEIGKETIRRIVAQASSVREGDVFFFMPPFNDPNDKKPSSLSYRMPAVKRALDQGALFVFSYAPLGKEIPHIVLENPREANISLIRHIRENYEIEVIGVTGSIGKTSTKDMLQKTLSEGFRTRCSLRNFNNQVSIAQHVQDLSGTDEILVQEIGGEHPGGVSRHARMVGPSIGVITNIRDAHIGNFGSREKILENKLGMIEAMGEEGRLYLNGDDPLLWKADIDVPVTYYAIDNKDADYFADDIVESDGRSSFTLVHGDRRVPLTLNVLGRHNVLNAVCSFAIAEKLGMSDESIASGLRKFETSGSRQNLISVAGYDLFVDCFNSLPDSVDASLSVLDSMQATGSKIAVIGDITGMGSMAESVHEKVAEIVLNHDMDILVCYGEQSKKVHQAALANGKNSVSIVDPDELEDYILGAASPGDAILFKASSKMNLSDRIDSMFGTLLSAQSFLDHAETRKTKIGPIEYVRNPKFSVVHKSDDVDREIKVKKQVLGRPVVGIDDGAFLNCTKISDVKLPPSLRHIGDSSFANASGMVKLDLPGSVRFVGKEAFRGCSSLTGARLNEGLMHISDRAFKDCGKLGRINLPSSISYIGIDAFEGCDNVSVECEKGTYAYEYCSMLGIRTVS